jgi:predicted nucleic acid-binding protein
VYLTKDVVVESDILIDFLKGIEGARNVLEKAADAGVIRVSAVSAAELAASSTDVKVDTARELLDSFGILPVDKEVAILAGLYRTHGPGSKYKLCDCLVAATCEQLGAVLLTKDRSRYPPMGFEVMLANY